MPAVDEFTRTNILRMKTISKKCHFYFLIIATLTGGSCSVLAQSKPEKVERERGQEEIYGTLVPPDTIDRATFYQLKDHGALINGVKHGPWIEYNIDSLEIGEPAGISVDNEVVAGKTVIIYRKLAGSYKIGKREGNWITYECTSTDQPLVWNKKSESEYVNDLKNGREVFYHGSGENIKPLIISHFKNGVEEGEGRIYSAESPYLLQKVYIAKDKKLILTEEYYPNGLIHFLIRDTVVNQEYLKFFRSFDEKTMLINSGYFLNDTLLHGPLTTYYKNGNIESVMNYDHGKEHGIYTFYHENGKLWSERRYENAKAIDVISNFDNKGKPMDKGTLKNGNGTVILYNEDGVQVGVRKYVNGEIVKEP